MTDMSANYVQRCELSNFRQPGFAHLIVVKLEINLW